MQGEESGYSAGTQDSSGSDDEGSDSDSDSSGGLPTSIAQNRPGYVPTLVALPSPVPLLNFGSRSAVTSPHLQVRSCCCTAPMLAACHK